MCAKSQRLGTARPQVKRSSWRNPWLIGALVYMGAETSTDCLRDTMPRDRIKTETVTAMKAGDKGRVAALRLISAKVKDRDIEMRGKDVADDDALVVDVLQKMAKQRRESIQMYEDGGRTELAEQEKAELAVIEEFMPQQMGEDETRAAIEQVKADTGAAGMKDMGKVMAELKARHGPQLDMARASGWVKESLS